MQAFHHVGNLASGKIMLKSGMKYEWRLRQYIVNNQGDFVDCDYYSVVKSKSIKLSNGDIITFDYELKEKSGRLVATFEDAYGNVIYTFKPNSHGSKEIKIDKDGTYELIIVGDKARGSYKFEWVINN